MSRLDQRIWGDRGSGLRVDFVMQYTALTTSAIPIGCFRFDPYVIRSASWCVECLSTV